MAERRLRERVEHPLGDGRRAGAEEEAFGQGAGRRSARSVSSPGSRRTGPWPKHAKRGRRAATRRMLGEGAAISTAIIPFLLAAILLSWFGLQRRKWQQGESND